MRMRGTWFAATMLLAFSTGAAAGDAPQTYRDPSAAIDARVAALLARMTPEEKFWQLFMLAGEFDHDPSQFQNSLYGLQISADGDPDTTVVRVRALQRHFVDETRLGIPVIVFAEAVHGLVQRGATVFPQAIAMAATFDTTLVREVARTVAGECRRVGVRQVLSPVVNLATDVRWGRVEETYGESPRLAVAMAVAFVSPLERAGVVTTAKHFIANVGDGGRDSYPIAVGERHLREVLLPPFTACVQEGGSRAVMTAYNSFDGSPCSAHPWLLRQVLRRDLGFTGVILSDAGGVGGANVLHMTARDYADAGQRALRSGLDVIFQTQFAHHLLFEGPFLDGTIDSTVIDAAVTRVLRLKFALGLFEDPLGDLRAWPRLDGPENQRLARRAAERSLVLLKNDHGVLPLSPSLRSVAVIGPDADELRLGGYTAPTSGLRTYVDAIRDRLGASVSVMSAVGASREAPRLATVPDSCLSRHGDRGLRGEYFANVTLTGPAAFVRTDDEVAFQWTLFGPDPERLPNDFYSVRWIGEVTAPGRTPFRLGVEGDDGYRLWVDDVLVVDDWQKTSFSTRLSGCAFAPGRPHRLKLECYEPMGGARIRLVWDLGPVPDAAKRREAALAAVAASDAAVIVVGIEEGEFRDRASLDLPGDQAELITRAATLGKPTVVVVVGGSAVTMRPWLDQVDAVLMAWYPGQEGSDAVAAAIFGDVDPAGRLPITFPVAEGQLPLVFDHQPTGRGDDYVDLTGKPQFPFGFGLSYTTFRYDGLRITPASVAAGETASVHVRVTNTGPRAGDEVAQLYLRDELAGITRPVTELAGFQRLHLAAGESADVSFAVTPDLLTMLGADLQPVIEPGAFRVMVGGSSADIRLRGTLVVAR